MPFVTAKSQQRSYDVIVVGSGAAGGQTAYTLCMEGARVLMLEAGRRYRPESETPMFQTPDLAPLGGEGTPQKPFGLLRGEGGGGLAGPGRAIRAHHRGPWGPLRLVAGTHARWTHQPLGT